MMKYPHNQPNSIFNILIFIRGGLPSMIIPLEQLDIKNNPTYTTPYAVVLVSKFMRLVLT